MELWTSNRLANVLGVTDRQIRYYIADGKLEAQKIGKSWVISDDEAKRFIDIRQEQRPPRSEES